VTASGFTPVEFTSPDKARTRIARTPAQAVRLRFNGWRETVPSPAPRPITRKTSSKENGG
jgi:carbamate kinase